MFLLFVQLSTDVLEIKGAAGFLTKWRWPGKKCHRCEFARINQKKFCTHHHLDAWMRSLRNMLSHMGKSWALVFLCWKQHQNMYCGPAGYNAFPFCLKIFPSMMLSVYSTREKTFLYSSACLSIGPRAYSYTSPRQSMFTCVWIDHPHSRNRPLWGSTSRHSTGKVRENKSGSMDHQKFCS